jgi:IS605 OrfB family transposase
LNKAARIFITHCLENNIVTVVFGWNKGQKDGVDMGKKNNQTFLHVPTLRLKDRMAKLCEQYGIGFV